MIARVVASTRDILDLLEDVLGERDEVIEERDSLEKDIEEMENKPTTFIRNFTNGELARMVSTIEYALSLMPEDNEITDDLMDVKNKLDNEIDSNYDIDNDEDDY